ncbi:MAG: DMT family transporter [Nanoarchaeota archaeon]|nr:DMT family transporter [Nanoarchaeota archaeon]
MNQIKYPAYVIIAMLIFGSMGIFARLSGQSGIVIAAAASLVSAFFMFFILLKKKELKLLLTKKIGILLLIGLFGAANNSLYFYAFSMTKISNAVFLHYLAPVFVIVLSWLILKEKAEARKIIAVIIAMAGLLFVAGIPSLEASSIGNLLAISSAVFYAASLITYKKAMRHFSLMQIIFVQMSFTAIIFMPFLLKAAPLISGNAWLYLGIIGIVHQFIAVIFHLKGLQALKATTVAILGYTEPVFAAVFAWIFLSELLGLAALAGGILIIGASFLATLGNFKYKNTAEEN